MASPQLEEGHLALAHEIVESLAKIRISGTEWQILWVILRKTYGWHKKLDVIPLSQFEAMTGLSRPHVVRYLKKLLQKKVIFVAKIDRNAVVYGFNKDYDKWKPLPKRVALPKHAADTAGMDNDPYPEVQKSLRREGPPKDRRDIQKGRYGLHVELTSDEYEKLVGEFSPGVIADVIEFFDLKIESTGVAQWRKYHESDYATILYWERNGWIKLGTAGPSPILGASSRGIMGWAERERERRQRLSEEER
jgi:phage replication O-like protein O